MTSNYFHVICSHFIHCYPLLYPLKATVNVKIDKTINRLLFIQALAELWKVFFIEHVPANNTELRMKSWSCVSIMKSKDGWNLVWKWNLLYLSTTQAIIPNYSCDQVSFGRANSSRSVPSPFGTWYLPATWHPTPGSASTLSSAAGNTEGGGENLLAKNRTPDNTTVCLKVKSKDRDRHRRGSKGGIIVLHWCPASLKFCNSHNEESLSFSQVPPNNKNANMYKWIS